MLTHLSLETLERIKADLCRHIAPLKTFKPRRRWDFVRLVSPCVIRGYRTTNAPSYIFDLCLITRKYKYPRRARQALRDIKASRLFTGLSLDLVEKKPVTTCKIELVDITNRQVKNVPINEAQRSKLNELLNSWALKIFR
jgi:hypothetical protein